MRESIEPWTPPLSRVPTIFTISRNVATGSRYNGPGEALYPPPHHLGRYRCDAYGDYLFCGPAGPAEAADLAVDAMQRVQSGARLKIAGEGPPRRMRKQIEDLGVADRVELLGFVSAATSSWASTPAAAPPTEPLNEDYGYVTVEAYLSSKPVITTTDAGGPRFVTDGEDGLVARPSPRPSRTPSTGCGAAGGWPRWARRAGAGPDISWDHVIDRLTEGLR